MASCSSSAVSSRRASGRGSTARRASSPVPCSRVARSPPSGSGCHPQGRDPRVGLGLGDDERGKGALGGRGDAARRRRRCASASRHDGRDRRRPPRRRRGRRAPRRTRVQGDDRGEHEAEPREAQSGARPDRHDLAVRRSRPTTCVAATAVAKPSSAVPSARTRGADARREHCGERGEHERHDERRERRVADRATGRRDELVPAAPAAARASRARAATPRARRRRAGRPGVGEQARAGCRGRPAR